MFYESMSLNSVFLLLLANFVSGFRLELMYISLIESIRSTLIHLHGFQLLVLKIEIYRNHFFCLCQKDKFSESKVKFRQASNRCERVFEAAKLAYANKTKESITSQKLGSPDFLRIANSVLSKGKYATPPLFNDPEVLSSASDKAKFFGENFSENSNLDYSGISLLVFSSRTNLKLYNISITPNMVKKVIMNLHFSKASGSYCVPVVILKNCDPELSCILAELFNMCLKESSFPDCWKVSLVIPVFKNVGKRSAAKNYHLLVFFLWLVKSLKNL